MAQIEVKVRLDVPLPNNIHPQNDELKCATHQMSPKGAGRKATRKLADGQVRTSCLVAISLRRGRQEADLWVAPDP